MRRMLVHLGGVYLFVASVACLVLSGCGSVQSVPPPPQIIRVDVPVPVPSPCVPATLKPSPEYPDTDEALLAAGPARDPAAAAIRYKLLGAGHPMRVARLAELETVVAACPKAVK